ncbi:tRNA (adenosine(37)-N6)-threonylcarbamoyltransferase complex dimerization subunit type 1 TsaB [Streptomyces sp. B1866]|uniref:tRNA (adenosine(37)-N6)-threonylcarbamoyltransferase complex dimerization subunit type 1 TsaB n=1 Tax=Streptomyces sp. B1866 TaxID=3075431 RepID=UPI00288CDB5A|nr:tRNA (adenosine(37)-N6)-threonylcarbamoyltransferase complex dimerization subunit type 1 TsaB [Streptomyces sp. B1866]MDT3397556.1 tRNA (adenosine(37)-N6)-threonylcarbamoyltransferase complex dimerization subunit type 1 TsaB [Streptomyces sp. B1866]
MLVLALDTATPAVTVALHDGTAVLAESRQVDARRHGELLLPAVHRVLAEAGVRLGAVTDIVAGVGPGPYTGLRVGLATADAFGAALGVPVRGLCTLDGIAYEAVRAGGLAEPFVVATDARRKEVYWARYEPGGPGGVTRVAGPAVDRPADIAERVAGLPVAGAGAALYPEVLGGAARPGLPEHQSAGALAALAAEKLAAGESATGEPAAGAFLPNRPLYLRRPDARVPANYKVVTPR